nr:hypothetical protein [bacterium]
MRSRIQKTMISFYYPESQETLKELILSALVLWRFALNTLTNHSWEIRRKFLSQFIDHENYGIRLVAQIESLPTSIWRKILWKQNIDFVTFESFLRRISSLSADAINNNYSDLMSGKLPSILNKVAISFKKITVDKLLNEPLNLDKRYMSKNSMSYNLLSLDFGFNAYPKGPDDDTKVLEISPLRFISKKKHVDDFVVNKEDGKYWWLYRTARSNYVVNSKKEVKLNTHICPGFSYTLIIHSLFWIVSPIAFVIFLIMFMTQGMLDSNIWIIVGLISSGMITPLWLISAVLKPIMIFISKYMPNYEISKEQKKKIGVITNWVLIATSSLSALCLIFFNFYHIIDFITTCFYYFGMVPVLAVLLLLTVYIGYKIYYYNTTSHYHPELSDYPLIIQLIMVAIVTPFVINFFTIYNTWLWSIVVTCYTYILHIITIALTVLLNIIAIFGIASLIFVLPIILSLMLVFFSRLDEEKQIKLAQFAEKAFFYSYFVILFIGICSLSYTIYLRSGLIGKDMIYVISTLLTIGLFSWIMKMVSFRMNPRIKMIIQDAKDAVYVSMISNYERIKYTPNYKDILKNEWLISMDSNKRSKAINKIIYDFIHIFIKKDNAFSCCNASMPYINAKSLNLILKHADDLIFLMNDRLRHYTISYIVIDGEEFEEAMKRGKEDLKIYDKTILTLKNIGKLAAVIPNLILLFIKAIISGILWIWNAIKTLYRLYELFQERCPYVAKPKTLYIK